MQKRNQFAIIVKRVREARLLRLRCLMVLKSDLLQRPRNQLSAQKSKCQVACNSAPSVRCPRAKRGVTVTATSGKKEKRQSAATRLCSPRLRRHLHQEQLSECVPFLDNAADACCLGTYIVFSTGSAQPRREIGEDVDAVDGGGMDSSCHLTNSKLAPLADV